MRFQFFLIIICSFILVGEVQAQSGYRGSGSRTGGARTAPGGSAGIVSRVGGARAKTIPMQGRPTGLINSGNAVRMGSARGSGSGYRPSPIRSSGAGSYAPPATRSLTGSGRPPRRSSGGRTTQKKSNLGSGTTNPVSSPSFSSLGLDDQRTWTDASGRFSIRGKLAAQQDEWVWIRRTDGRLAKLRLQQLSAADQQFVKSQG